MPPIFISFISFASFSLSFDSFILYIIPCCTLSLFYNLYSAVQLNKYVTKILNILQTKYN